MKRKLYIVATVILLVMPNIVATSESNSEGQVAFSNKSLSPWLISQCSPAPIGISYGKTTWWKENWCRLDQYFMTPTPIEDMLVCMG